jgi:acyl carrier protein
MNNTDTFLALTEIFHRIFQDDTIVLRPEMTASDVDGWDSFRQVEILLAAQERFGVKLRSRDIDAMHCVGDMIAVIDRRRAGAP